ncbi:complement decay-accelerating factor-like isoform X2 [Ascaphus truei]|uniref:complement decay-accelerating factor-like isoform X2 n=1 Tax=Ascaphus truei TaxID=8439 RepID=UPI003F59636E
MMSPLSHSVTSHCAFVLLYFAALISGTPGDCGPPPVIEHTQPLDIVETSFPTGHEIVYSCDRTTGYYDVPGKSRTITCLDTTTWSEIPVFCERGCPSPHRLQYAELKAASVSQNIFLPGSRAKYTCRPGYIRVPGANTAITCLPNFTWTAAEVFCARRSCGSPGAIDNGYFDVPDFLLGSRAKYFCNDGFRMSRRNYRDCLADGSWSNTVPECEAVICPLPDAITDGTYSPAKDEYSYLDTVTYACNSKILALVGKISLFCTKHGTWNSDVPKCKAVECLNPNFPNSRRLSGFQGPYRLNSAISFECVEGFTMRGSSMVTCSLSNEWEPPLPECLNPAFTNKPTKGGKASAQTGSNKGLNIGLVCGVIVFLLLIAVGVCWCLRKRGSPCLLCGEILPYIGS